MHQILHGLERQGLIVRTAHPQHGRILETRPTAEGRQRLAQADAAVRGVEERMLAPLDARGTRALEEALAACAEALGG
jgi:DNA-binding MarR family transcriptional regulator